MKIVCDNCSAKYSIADEKVAGKVFKIRCKKCASVIVVRGNQASGTNATQAGGASEATAAAPDAVWHVVVDGEQQGPLTLDRVSQMLGDGTIDWDAYIWREGFDGWKPAREVSELSGQQNGGARTPSRPPAAEASSAASMGADPFAAAAAGAAGGGAAAGAAASSAANGSAAFGNTATGEAQRVREDAGADLFAQSTASSPFAGSGTGDIVASPAPSPRVGEVGPGSSMTGQRNENSVLFSLSNLQALASGPSAPAAAASTPAPQEAAPAGHAAGEGSGLIDIRALASATSTSQTSSQNVDDLLAIGGSGGSLGSSLGAPMLAPPVAEPEKNNRQLIILGSVTGVLLLALIAVVIVVLMKDPEPVASAAGTTAISPTQEPAQPSAAQPGANANPTEAAPPKPSTTDEAKPSRPSASKPSSSSKPSRRSGSRSEKSSRASSSAPTPKQEASEPPAMRERNGNIDDLLAAALGGSKKPSRMSSSSASNANLPETPPRSAVLSALQSVSGRVRACGGGQHGVAKTAITFAGSTGRVRSARVTGQFAGTPVAKCVTRAVRSARVPKFKRASFPVNFPYRL